MSLNPLPLTLALGRYDQTRDLTDGLEPVEGVALRVLDLPIEEIFYRFVFNREWDISEMSMGKYIALRAQGDTSITAIPVFVSRMFRHSMFYVRAGGAVKRPADLRGKRIGIPEWAQTAGIYGRGWLAETAGVPLAEIEWVQGGVNQPGRVEKVKLSLPGAIRYRNVADRSLDEMLMDGAIDAIMSARPPRSLGKGVTRLISDYQAAEAEYFRATGIYPIMHAIVLRSAVLEQHPWVAMNLLKAFTRAKNNSLERMAEVTASHVPFAWTSDYAERMRALFGDDYFPYGCGEQGTPGERLNHTTLDAFLRFGFEQGVCAKRLAPAELFPRSVLSAVKV